MGSEAESVSVHEANSTVIAAKAAESTGCKRLSGMKCSFLRERDDKPASA